MLRFLKEIFLVCVITTLAPRIWAEEKTLGPFLAQNIDIIEKDGTIFLFNRGKFLALQFLFKNDKDVQDKLLLFQQFQRENRDKPIFVNTSGNQKFLSLGKTADNKPSTELVDFTKGLTSDETEKFVQAAIYGNGFGSGYNACLLRETSDSRDPSTH